MEREEVYLIDLSGSGFRCGRPAKIIGIEMCTPKGLEPRLCYHLQWSDKVEDFKPVSEVTYKIVTFAELIIPIVVEQSEQLKCDVCGSNDVIEAPHMGRNCNDCNPL